MALLAMYDRALPAGVRLPPRPRRQRDRRRRPHRRDLPRRGAGDRARRGADLTVAWLIGVARHKLVDHWRRQAREARNLRLVPGDDAEPDGVDERFERARTREVLDELGPHHRAALTLRYLDGLSVPEVAHHLDRTVHATEALLVRARNAFRVAYARGECDGLTRSTRSASRSIPLAPRAEFAAALRRRLSVALGTTREAQPMKEVREYTPARLHSLTPYLATSDPAAAIEWYIEVFDAELLGDPIVMPDGRIGHAELRIGDTVFMLAGEFPEEDHRSPLTLGGSTVAHPGVRARLRRDVRARGRAGRDPVCARSARTTARAAA